MFSVGGASEAQIKRIEADFAELYAQWGIALPVGAAARREAGHIFQQGWHIGYIWGEENGEEYFEYLAQHRMMAGADHSRVWASGREEGLEIADGPILLPRGATDAEIAQIEHEHAARSRAISAELREKGLLPPVGENLGALEINEFLHSGGMVNDDDPASGTSSKDP
jgi:hypothetical protein